MGDFRDELKAQRNSWKVFLESQYGNKVEEDAGATPTGAGVTSAGIATVPTKLGQKPEDIQQKPVVENALDVQGETGGGGDGGKAVEGAITEEDVMIDEAQQKKIAALEKKREMMEQSMRELEEEIAFNEELGKKRAAHKQIKEAACALNDEIKTLKESKKKPVAAKVETEKEEVEGPGADETPKHEKAEGEKVKEEPKAEEKKEEKKESKKEEKKESKSKEKKEEKAEKKKDLKEGYIPAMTRLGKSPAAEPVIVEKDLGTEKKKQSQEAYKKYLATKKPANPQDKDGFTFVLG